MSRGTLDDGNLLVNKAFAGGRSAAQMNMRRSSKSERRSQFHRQAHVKESLTKLLDEGFDKDVEDVSQDNPIKGLRKYIRNGDNTTTRRHSAEVVRSRCGGKDEGLGDSHCADDACLDQRIEESRLPAGKDDDSIKRRQSGDASHSHSNGTNQAKDQYRRRSSGRSRTPTSSCRTIKRSQSAGKRLSSKPTATSNSNSSANSSESLGHRSLKTDVSIRENKHNKDGSKINSNVANASDQKQEKPNTRASSTGLLRGDSGRIRRVAETPQSPSALGASPGTPRRRSMKSRHHHANLTPTSSDRRKESIEVQSEQVVREKLSEVLGNYPKSRGSLDNHLADQGSKGGRRRLLQDNQSLSSGLSNITNSRGGRSLGHDAGPLNGVLNSSLLATRRTSVGGEDASHLDKSLVLEEQQFIEQRKSRQDEILKFAQSTQFDHADQDDSNDHYHTSTAGGEQLGGRISDGEDEDQPILKYKRKSPLARLRSGLAKTGKVTKSTAKGTVNVVRDPKRAAKKVGGFAKDVGTETVQMAMNPKLAAMKAANLGKDVTKGTLLVTRGVGKGVAKVGVGATTMVLGTALDGAGKVIHGANGLIFKHGQGEEEQDGFAEYRASELECRRVNGLSLMDRIANVADLDSPEKSGAGLPEAFDTNETIEKRNPSTPQAGLMVPALNLKSGTKGWDF